MSQRQFTYLQNGQTVSEQERLKKLLAEDPTAVLSVCRLRLEEAVERTETIDRSLLVHRKRAVELLERIVGEARAAAGQIPQSVGFFVSPEERRATLDVTVHLLKGLDLFVKDLRALLLSLSGEEREMHLCIGSFLEAEKLLSGVIVSCDGASQAARECRALLNRMQETKDRFSHIRQREGELRRLLQGLSVELLPRLSQRISAQADLANDGRSASAAGARAAIGELQHVTEEHCRSLLESLCVGDNSPEQTEL